MASALEARTLLCEKPVTAQESLWSRTHATAKVRLPGETQMHTVGVGWTVLIGRVVPIQPGYKEPEQVSSSYWRFF